MKNMANKEVENYKHSNSKQKNAKRIYQKLKQQIGNKYGNVIRNKSHQTSNWRTQQQLRKWKNFKHSSSKNNLQKKTNSQALNMEVR